MTDQSQLITTFNSYINGDIAVSRHIANQLWEFIESQALHIAPQYADEMTCVLMTRLFNRRTKPHQPINTPKSYIITALKNIRTDIWRREKRRAGYQDHLGEFHYHQSLDSMVFNDGQSMHERVAAGNIPSEPIEDIESIVLSIVRNYLYDEEIKQLSLHTTEKGERTFLECAQHFQSFALNQYQPGNQTDYKRFDRQRKKFLEHLTTSLDLLPLECMTHIHNVIEQYNIYDQRESILNEYKNDNTVNGEIISRQIDLQVALRTLVAEIERREINNIHLDILLEDELLRGLMLHCEYQIFRTEGYRTKRSKNAEINSMYFENV